ncbi:SEC-C metal-binding domain-containing protein [Clostridium cellulovorans]|uniref:SEC-C motif domain protein n=1 Tax=Clostridium cellulovorans (strain ATCC 35296 / DSM 3052 / OCM 3 / 743B) TaxID=573061 RepID=D9SNJ9_CLOC7|nr:SEC-C metal-binding domain-containing protein [Clostridium cellulovorans]ADL53991.1 SEC-C motif domain protein [Clostridium cellulovorans 743B]
MALYKQWTDMVIDYVKQKGEAAFWDEYSKIETKIYSKLLAQHKKEIKGSVEELAKEYEVDNIFFMGFVDGINESLVAPLELEEVEVDTEIVLEVDYEKLFFNMLDAKAQYLFTLPQWDGIFSEEKRKEIHETWKKSKTIVNENKVGRNDQCPCGSGKKYKKCCGKTA